MAQPWVGIGLVLAVFASLIIGLRACRRRYSLDPEWVRKSLHVFMGIVALGCPWLFAENWPVVSLALILALFLTALKFSRPLKRHCGGVIDAVKRESVGEICFPVAVGFLFVLAQGDPILFCIPVLILTFPDAAAAVVGSHWGRLRYNRSGTEKSIEGSLAFLACAFPSVWVPLILFSAVGPVESLLVALTLALLLTLIEALSPRGLDNLSLPFSAFFLLRNYLVINASQLATHLEIALFSFTLFISLCLRSLRDARQHQGGGL